jgi:hypothetical protein
MTFCTVSGLPEEGNDCSTGQIVVEGESGYLYGGSLLPTRYLAAGLLRCPWRIRARPGQEVKVTIIDITATSSSSQGQGQRTDSTDVHINCPAYVVFREEGETVKDVCVAGGRRQREVHESVGNELLVHVAFDTHARRSEHVHFLLKFEGEGRLQSNDFALMASWFVM